MSNAAWHICRGGGSRVGPPTLSRPHASARGAPREEALQLQLLPHRHRGSREQGAGRRGRPRRGDAERGGGGRSALMADTPCCACEDPPPWRAQVRRVLKTKVSRACRAVERSATRRGRGLHFVWSGGSRATSDRVPPSRPKLGRCQPSPAGLGSFRVRWSRFRPLASLFEIGWRPPFWASSSPQRMALGVDLKTVGDASRSRPGCPRTFVRAMGLLNIALSLNLDQIGLTACGSEIRNDRKLRSCRWRRCEETAVGLVRRRKKHGSQEHPSQWAPKVGHLARGTELRTDPSAVPGAKLRRPSAGLRAGDTPSTL